MKNLFYFGAALAMANLPYSVQGYIISPSNEEIYPQDQGGLTIQPGWLSRIMIAYRDFRRRSGVDVDCFGINLHEYNDTLHIMFSRNTIIPEDGDSVIIRNENNSVCRHPAMLYIVDSHGRIVERRPQR